MHHAFDNLKIKSSAILIAFGTLFVSECKKQTDESKTQAKQTTQNLSSGSRASFTNLNAYDVVSGPLEVKAEARAEVSKAALLANGEIVAETTGSPLIFKWDTSKFKDGLVELTLKASSPEGKPALARLPVVVVNQGSEVFFKNGSNGKIVIPPTGAEPQHLRYHFNVGEGIKKIIALLFWEMPDCEIEFALGQGTCPHHGKTKAKRTGRNSPIVLDFSADYNQTITPGQWFAHLRVPALDKHLGKEIPFSIKAFLLR